MAASLSALYDDAFAALERAIALDKLEKEEKGQAREEDRTMLQYEAAMDLFQQCYDRESDVSRKTLVESKMREYGKRLATLKATVGDRRWTEAKALDAGRGKAATDEQDEAVAGAYLEAVELYLGSMKLQSKDGVQDVALRVRVYASWFSGGEGGLYFCALPQERY
jgi:tetratricopeptide (TPR) repeat protein|eukprot:evm.model.NODE_12479_length_7425_cov_31.160809.2